MIRPPLSTTYPSRERHAVYLAAVNRRMIRAGGPRLAVAIPSRMSPDQPATVTVVARQGGSAHGISVAVIAWASTTTSEIGRDNGAVTAGRILQNGWDKGGIPSADGCLSACFV